MSKSAYSKFSVLVVDDHKTLPIARKLLQEIGFYDIDTVPDVETALHKLDIKRYDLILCEWNLPGTNGLELLQRVRSSSNTFLKVIPFVLLTTEITKENIVAAKQANVSNLIIKPLTLEGLKQKLEVTLNIPS